MEITEKMTEKIAPVDQDQTARSKWDFRKGHLPYASATGGFERLLILLDVLFGI